MVLKEQEQNAAVLWRSNLCYSLPPSCIHPDAVVLLHCPATPPSIALTIHALSASSAAIVLCMVISPGTPNVAVCPPTATTTMSYGISNWGRRPSSYAIADVQYATWQQGHKWQQGRRKQQHDHERGVQHMLWIYSAMPSLQHMMEH